MTAQRIFAPSDREHDRQVDDEVAAHYWRLRYLTPREREGYDTLEHVWRRLVLTAPVGDADFSVGEAVFINGLQQRILDDGRRRQAVGHDAMLDRQARTR